MKQQTLAMAADQGAGFETHCKRTRRDEFLDTMNAIVPWAQLCVVIEPHYPKRGNGRPPIGLERMLRIHFVQHWFNLADFACEEALYDSTSLRRFAGIDLGCEAVPDATTLLKFRRLLETHKLGEQWYFGAKLHIGVDSQSGRAHSAVLTPVNVHDKHPLPQLLHGREQRVYGDNAYASQKELIHSKAPRARDFTNQRTRRAGGEVDEVQRGKNRNKSKIRARVEHVFAVVKRLWGFTKVRYRGLAKNANRAFIALALANFYLSRKKLMAPARP
ncbi:IS5 family transposase [Paraburkholderia sp. RAU2J]|uniref:transposase n=1 Tax=Paraburkholderia sp. RAU2J TaxID=1938810 RepID=UPI000EB017E2|nr:transposase [Paraburkholderia sp. RAU2J]RKT10376.1 IS5 family transposase [Paraburkholderia sp. RAU2J]